jgi:hypothetical protein
MPADEIPKIAEFERIDFETESIKYLDTNNEKW